MSYFLGDTVLEPFTIRDLSNQPLTGLTSPADVTITLHRQSGTAMIDATETVTFLESASAGTYDLTFVPNQLGLYMLQLLETSVLTGQGSYRWVYSILAAGSVFSPSFVNAFCAETDIERWLQTTIDSTTAPTDTQAAGFAEVRASVLCSLMARWGYSVTPATVTTGSRLEDMLREANAIGAAIDYTIAQQFSYQPSLSDRVAALQLLWEQYVGTAKEDGFLYLEVRGNLASLSTDHVISGDTAAYVESTPVAGLPIGIGMGSLF